jgi:hypothetical protein
MDPVECEYNLFFLLKLRYYYLYNVLFRMQGWFSCCDEVNRRG